MDRENMAQLGKALSRENVTTGIRKGGVLDGAA